MAVRAITVEIWKFAPDRRDAWKALAIACQRMQNRLWQIWLCHHANRGSAQQLREHFHAFKTWQEDNKGARPVWPCKALEPPLTASADAMSFYRILSAEFPDVNVRTRGLLTNAWQSKLNSRKSATGALPGWVAILFANESLPSFTRPQPIPFDKENSKLLRIDGKYYIELRIERLADSGKSVVERCELMLNKYKTASMRAIVDRLIDGEWAWKGSNLVFDRGKWFVALSFDKPVTTRTSLDPDRVVYVRPGRKGPWQVRVSGRRYRAFGGRGDNVTHARLSIINERGSRKEHYRWGGSNQKGHGRRRADTVWTKLSSRYKDFVKRYNSEISRQIINVAISNGCGRIVYLQPRDHQRNSRFLTVAGNIGQSGMLWDYFQFGAMMASKCETEGIEYGAKAKPKKKAKDKTVASGV